jgi:hypothetical protein
MSWGKSMRWLEIIFIRTGRVSEGRIDPVIEKMTKVYEVPHLVEAACYSHAMIPGDYAVILSWDIYQPNLGSDLALGLMQELKRFGLVDHSLWVAGETFMGNPLDPVI